MRTRSRYRNFARQRLVSNAGDAQICWMKPGDLWHKVVANYVIAYRYDVRIPRSFRHMMEKTDA